MPCLPVLLLLLSTVGAEEVGAEWPHSVQPFYLSATYADLSADEARYLSQLPVVVINHKQGGTGSSEEEKQLHALSQVKAANPACKTFFYLNSQIDFPGLQLHTQFAANGSWWLRDDAGDFVLHDNDHIFDLTVEAARNTWLSVAKHALSQPFISGVFVDKAGDFFDDAWSSSHLEMLESLGATAAAVKKQLIFNNVGIAGMAGQLFERWAENPDHDGLNFMQDIALLENATDFSNAGQLNLLRAGGVRSGTIHVEPPEVCGAGLAAMLVAVASPNAAFFACMPSFNIVDGWRDLDKNEIYKLHLGAPKGKAVVGKDGIITRDFEGAHVALDPKTNVNRTLTRGCVQWASGETTGVCPHTRK